MVVVVLSNARQVRARVIAYINSLFDIGMHRETDIWPSRLLAKSLQKKGYTGDSLTIFRPFIS